MQAKRPGSNKRLIGWLRHDETASVFEAWRSVHQYTGTPHDLVHQAPIDPAAFTNPESFREAYWQQEVWSKYPFEIGLDRKAVAIQSFREAEAACARANDRLHAIFEKPIPERYRAYLRRAQSLLAHLFEGFSLDEVIEHCGWGPGATTSLPRARAVPSNKWVNPSTHITRAALPYYYAFCEWSGRVFPRPAIVEGNKIVTVAKNAKTDRTIAIEPDWNMFFQLGFGGAIRRRLQSKFGLLKPIAGEVNQNLARLGSLNGLLATIDLKGASDSVSLAIVDELFPRSVSRHLLALRSPHGELDGEQITYEKISSMGNGYTFELETALFYCLVRASSGHAVAFGDDIITIAAASNHVVEFLQFCGFEVNVKKSFSQGPFRESCGGHYFRGVNVTPPYVRKPLKAESLLSFCNRVVELSDNGRWTEGLYRSVWEVAARSVPRFLFGPTSVDGVLHVPFDKAVPSYSKNYQTFKGSRLIVSTRSRSGSQVGGLYERLWKHPEGLDRKITRSNPRKHETWRVEIPDHVKCYSLGTWRSHWQEHSSWAADLVGS